MGVCWGGVCRWLCDGVECVDGSVLECSVQMGVCWGVVCSWVCVGVKCVDGCVLG